MRRELERRPLVVLCAGLLLGVSCWYVLANVGFLLAAFLVLGWGSTPKRWLLGRLQWIFLAGVGLSLIRPPAVAGEPIREPKAFSGDVTLLSVPRPGPSRQRALAQAGPVRVALSMGASTVANLGDRFRVDGELRPLSEAGEEAWRSDGAVGELRAIRMVRQAQGPWLFRLGAAVRRSFGDFVERTFDPRAASTLQAICFGQEGEMDPASVEAFRRTGTIHIMATSGLHVMLLAWLVYLSLAHLPVPRIAQITILIALLALYAAATGFRPPAVRAAVMASVFASAYLFAREPDALSSLSLSAGVVLMLMGAEQVVDIGFQISFVTVAALALSLERRWPAPDGWAQWISLRARQAFAVTLVAWLASMPLIAYHFGQVSLVSLPANLAIAPVLPALIGLALGGWLVAALWHVVGVGLMAFAQWLVGYVLAVVTAIAAWPYATLPIPVFSGYFLVVAYGLALLLWRPRPRPA